MAEKSNKGLQFYINYQKLNALTKKNRYSLLLIDKTFHRLAKVKIFTKLDICQAFYRIYIHPNSEKLTAFRTKYNQFKYNIILFNLTNGLVIYQQYINKVLFKYLNIFYTIYFNNILIYSDNELEYKYYIKKVLEQFRKASL